MTTEKQDITETQPAETPEAVSTEAEQEVSAKSSPPEEYKELQRKLAKAQREAKAAEERYNQVLQDVQGIRDEIRVIGDYLVGREMEQETGEEVWEQPRKKANPIIDHRQASQQEQLMKEQQAAKEITKLLKTEAASLPAGELGDILEMPSAAEALRKLRILIDAQKQPESTLPDMDSRVRELVEQRLQQELRERGLLKTDTTVPTGSGGPKDKYEAARMYNQGLLTDKEYANWLGK